MPQSLDNLSPRKLYFISGNPHYEKEVSGVIEFFQDVAVDTSDRRQFLEAKNINDLLCILCVPSFMIHEVKIESPGIFFSCSLFSSGAFAVSLSSY